MLREDFNLSPSDVKQLANRDEVAIFFGKLGYDVQPISQTIEALQITTESLARQINYVEELTNQDDLFRIYLFEMKSMRAADRQALARNFREQFGDFLFVITSDYDTIDFVLMQKTLPHQGKSKMQTQRVMVTPRVLTVNRHEPSRVAQRVLRRFTNTEADPISQVDKILSAYTVADWSEEMFNNRALFSDYYLKERLRDRDDWKEEPTRIYNNLRGLVVDVRSRLSQETEQTTRQQLLEPALQALGFLIEEGKNSTSDADEPDYFLYGSETDENPLALCLAYKWDRYLDGRDDTRDEQTPEENPGAKVVSLLEKHEVPFIILTNGKTWRLYAKQAHSRATNYYEIDLEETLAAPDRAEAIRYFWLFFRREAFEPQEVIVDGEPRSLIFLEQLMEGSENYAKELGERLKERVFETIFPHFAEGFITNIRQQEGKQADLSQERLDMIYQGTLTFLYRLMFLLYAESRDLLPVREVHGYWEASLERIKDEIAQKAGTILDETNEKIIKAYGNQSTELYQRLNALFRVIDKGDYNLNVPLYNGGLFITEPEETDLTADAEQARFLAYYAIPDRYLALGLDRLARDLDPKTKALVMIDFKSLGVRQLGSIYEGLLEFKLRVAIEKMAVVKGKRTEQVMPYAEAVKPNSKVQILTEGRGADKREKIIPEGGVYLENTRQERKATGSYYTPDYIVKYIVQHTVGPVLEERFNALRPRLREAERAFFQHKQNLKGAKAAENPEKFWNDDKMQQLAYDVLDIKVLDPAMGAACWNVR